MTSAIHDSYDETGADGEPRRVSLDRATEQLRKRVFDLRPSVGQLREAWEANSVCVGCQRRIANLSDAMLIGFLGGRVAHAACFTLIVDTHDHPLLHRSRAAVAREHGAPVTHSRLNERGPGSATGPTGTSAGAPVAGQPSNKRTRP